MSSSKNRFYDIHMHVFNLSHAGLMAFINRFFLNNALDFNDLLKGKYLKILRYYFFKKGHTEAESKKIMRRRRLKVSFRILLVIAWAGLWFYLIPKYLYFMFPNICSCWATFLSWMVYVIGFLFAPVLLYILYKLFRMMVKKIFCKKKKSKTIPHAINVLSIFENDLAHQLRYLEMDYLSKHKDIKDYIATADNPGPEEFYRELQKRWEAHGSMLEINKQPINKVIITPLMMNFNSKGFEKLDKNLVHYNLPPAKLIIEQLVDLFNGIQNYCRMSLQLMEVYPLMGVNPGTYSNGSAVHVGFDFVLPGTLVEKLEYLDVIGVLVFLKKLDEDEQNTLLASVQDDKLKGIIKQAMDDFHLQSFKDNGFPGGNTFPKMLDKYFGKYHGDSDEFAATFEKTFIKPEGAKTWRDIRSNFFCGLKVYPPLGFDPYPLEELTEEEKAKAGSAEELARMEEDHFNVLVNTHYMYQYCVKKNIPLTTHCSDGGFVIMDERWSRERANPQYWAGALYDYPELKLNFGHFGTQQRSAKHGWGDWNKTIIDLILNDRYPNVYADISDLGGSLKEYKYLGDAIQKKISSLVNKGHSEEELYKKLYSNLLFGTDFMVNLFHTDSYLAYINTWEKTGIFTEEDKVRLASENPHRFLFGAQKKRSE